MQEDAFLRRHSLCLLGCFVVQGQSQLVLDIHLYDPRMPEAEIVGIAATKQ
jgi:hypothetical protein